MKSTGRKHRAALDPLEAEMERAFWPGRFIGYDESSGFVAGLEAIRDQVTALAARAPERAVALYESLLAGCYSKIEDADDSDGELGDFTSGVFPLWVAARQAAGAPSKDTAERLTAFHADDDYGFCSGREAVEALDAEGLMAYEAATRRRWRSGQGHGLVDILKDILRKRSDVGAYVALCAEVGALVSADCEALAGMCLSLGHTDDALAWVERGLSEADRPDYRLPSLRRRILQQLGRGEEALRLAWEAYRQHPSPYTYDELERYVPAEESSSWRERALEVAMTAPLADRIQLLVGMAEQDRLARVVEEAGREALMGLSHFTTEPAAEALEATHPVTAARLQAALGLRILEAKKSRYYPEALAHFKRARRLFLEAKEAREWTNLSRLVHSRHGRKYGFIPGFKRVEAGDSMGRPSFLERARERWTAGRESEVGRNGVG